jgi:hypothetical protein
MSALYPCKNFYFIDFSATIKKTFAKKSMKKKKHFYCALLKNCNISMSRGKQRREKEKNVHKLARRKKSIRVFIFKNKKI